ncbi:hypothetical protein CRG98_032315 [Punica granatum]|uniref:Uncharacterized protein n=1 Tax=Punica granatum TaxID=22663 RepID=A0A2I0ITE7_PUNGR|nr:hypothetical protein CRG98_032315 [Punica granatum]
MGQARKGEERECLLKVNAESTCKARKINAESMGQARKGEERECLLKVNAESTVYGPECGRSSGPALRAFGSRGSGVSTFPWGRVTDTLERRSRHLSFYDP